MEQKQDQKQGNTGDPSREQDKMFFNLLSKVMHARGGDGELLIMRNYLTRPFPYNLPQAGWCDAVVELTTFTYLFN